MGPPRQIPGLAESPNYGAFWKRIKPVVREVDVKVPGLPVNAIRLDEGILMSYAKMWLDRDGRLWVQEYDRQAKKWQEGPIHQLGPDDFHVDPPTVACGNHLSLRKVIILSIGKAIDEREKKHLEALGWLEGLRQKLAERLVD